MGLGLVLCVICAILFGLIIINIGLYFLKPKYTFIFVGQSEYLVFKVQIEYICRYMQAFKIGYALNGQVLKEQFYKIKSIGNVRLTIYVSFQKTVLVLKLYTVMQKM